MSHVFQTQTEILLSDRDEFDGDDNWALCHFGPRLTDEEKKELREGASASLFVEWIDGAGIQIRLHPNGRESPPADEAPTSLFTLRLDEEAAIAVVTALQGILAVLRDQRASFEQATRR